MYVHYYKGAGLIAWLVRKMTAKPGQDFETVPAHVAISDGIYVWEAVITGVKCRRLSGYESQWLNAPSWSMFVEVDAAKAVEWLDEQVGDKYDFQACAFDLMGKILPPWLVLNTERTDVWNCSRLVEGALLVAGCKMRPSRLPLSPNDLYLNLR